MKKLYLSPFNFKAVVLYHKLKKEGLQVDGFLDSNSYLWNKMYEGIGIYQRCYIPNAKVIVCAKEKTTNHAIRENLVELGYIEEDIEASMDEGTIINEADEINIKELLDIFPKSNSITMGVIEDIMKLKKMKQFNIDIENINYEELLGLNRKEIFNDKIILNKFEVIVTNKCSLKCKKCAAGIQYFEHPTDFETKNIIKDYNRIIELIDWTDRIVIIGGEPFLYGELDEVLNGIFKNPNTEEKVGAVKIITNGTVIPSKKVLEAIKKYGIIVWISNYGEKSRKIGELIDIFRKEKIDYNVLPLRKWSDVIQLNNEKNIQSKEQLSARRKNGCVTRCRTVANGKFYLCSLLKSMDCLGIEPFGDTDGVNLYASDAREQIVNMLDMEKPLPNACSFCSGCSQKDWDAASINAAEQVKKPLVYIKNRR